MTPSGWKEIAWNGVRFDAPRSWQPGRIGPRHLVLEADAGPAMELKWAPVRGRFSHAAHLKRMSSRAGAALRPWSLPEDWSRALARYESAGFAWDSGAQSARGAVLFCRACRTASLVQFFGPPGRNAPRAGCAAVLAGLEDHREDRHRLWAVYDIRARLPDELRLVRQRFDVGRFRLEFAGRGRRLILLRWAPAAALLGAGGLAAFAQAQAGSGALQFSPTESAGHPGVEGRAGPPAGVLARARAALGLAEDRCVRLWHVAARNRLLGVVLEGRRPITELEMNAACAGYGLAPAPPGHDGGAT